MVIFRKTRSFFSSCTITRILSLRNLELHFSVEKNESLSKKNANTQRTDPKQKLYSFSECVSVLKRWWEVGRRYEVQCGSMAAGGFWLCPSLLVWLVGWLKWLSGGVFNSSWPGWSDDIKTQSNVQNSIQKSLRIVAWLNIERTHINSPTDTQCSTIHASDTNNPANKLEKSYELYNIKWHCKTTS